MKLRSLFVALLLLSSLLIAPSALAEEAATSYNVAVLSVTTPPPGKDAKPLGEFIKSFLERDPRYVVTTTQEEGKTTHTLTVILAKGKKGMTLTLKGSALKGKDGDYEAALADRAPLAAIESEISRGLRELFDYKPPKRKLMIKVIAQAADGEADGAMVADAITKAVSSEFNTVTADPYKYPIKDENMAALVKGDKKLLAQFPATVADVLIVGTIQIPAVKNVGGAATNRYQGVAKVRIVGFDLKRQSPVTEVTMDLRGEGVFSELIYSLLLAAGQKSAQEVVKDFGLALPKAPEVKKEESKASPVEEDEEAGE